MGTPTCWTPHRRGYAQKLFRQGLTIAEAAQKLRVTRSALGLAVTRYQMNVPPRDLVTFTDLAVTLGISVTEVHRLTARRGITPGRWLGNSTVTAKEAAALQAEREPVLDSWPPNYLTAEQVAQRWDLTVSRAQARLREHEVPYVLVRVVGKPSPKRAYHPRDVDGARPPTHFSQRPAGTLDAEELAVILSRSAAMVRLWAQQGMPHLEQRGPKRERLFRLPEVVTWLQQHRDSRTRRLGAYIAAQQQREAA
ncbi:hypothetical protein [Deinococcus hopiensis]|uniref:Helix-turn-helix domain-containing protein n=1 Tax=Deinococcus hopiensis KR-140 TaxID=695939 RepID=A0A1W1VIY4_9DEIO|nr:hypothetical protein [Deinococcus hopiensis]SMB93345.1 hypothetical protein SAMN00790413_01946 [Deinococcus hopiensis KR-140]